MTFWPGSSCAIYPILYWSWDPNWDTILSARLAFWLDNPLTKMVSTRHRAWFLTLQSAWMFNKYLATASCKVERLVTCIFPHNIKQQMSGMFFLFELRFLFETKIGGCSHLTIHIDTMFPDKDHSRTPGRSSRSATVGYCLGEEMYFTSVTTPL